MPDIPRLNGAIRALEVRQARLRHLLPRRDRQRARPSAPRRTTAVVFEMEHNPYDIKALRDCMQYMLNRKQIATAGSIAPAVTPMVRIPPNGGENSQWIAKQVLDIGVYGVVWPHVSTVEDARNAVVACRYPRPREAPHYDPPGQRGDAPTAAARYWGLTAQDYYKRADVWPLNPDGRGPGGDHVRGEARHRQPAEDAGAGARHRRGADRRGRPVAGPRPSAPVRAPHGGLARSTTSWRSASSTTCPAAIRMSIAKNVERADRAGLPLADAGAGDVLRGVGAGAEAGRALSGKGHTP